MENECCKNSASENKLKQTVSFLKVISDENRLKILCLLTKQDMCVCDIWKHFNLSQNLVSHHLKVLKDFRLVDNIREGTKIIYKANKKNINNHSEILSHYLN